MKESKKKLKNEVSLRQQIKEKLKICELLYFATRKTERKKEAKKIWWVKKTVKRTTQEWGYMLQEKKKENE